MTIRVLFFAQARAVAGTTETMLPIEGARDADGLWQSLGRLFPELVAMRETIRISRNGEFVRETETFSGGDEIALIPPVSGG